MLAAVPAEWEVEAEARCDPFANSSDPGRAINSVLQIPVLETNRRTNSTGFRLVTGAVKVAIAKQAEIGTSR